MKDTICLSIKEEGLGNDKELLSGLLEPLNLLKNKFLNSFL